MKPCVVITFVVRSDLPCGEQLYDRGLQRLEAMLYAVDRFNSDKMWDKISFLFFSGSSWYLILLFKVSRQDIKKRILFRNFISRINDNKSLLPDIRLGKRMRLNFQ